MLKSRKRIFTRQEKKVNSNIHNRKNNLVLENKNTANFLFSVEPFNQFELILSRGVLVENERNSMSDLIHRKLKNV